MEEKKRTLLAVVISTVILVAVLYGFAVNLLGTTPEIEVVPPAASAGPLTSPGEPDGGGIPVEVTVDTVQAVIAGLSRYQSYSRTISIQYHWGEGESGGVTAQVRSDGGWTRCDATLASGIVEHSILNDETLWLWYDSQSGYDSGPATGKMADLMQYIPTYEDVLELERADIAAAGYEERGGLPCIRVEVEEDSLGYRERYWISVDSGLLVSAETQKEDKVVYTMSSYEVSAPLSDGSAFVLPDGTVLHTPAAR